MTTAVIILSITIAALWWARESGGPRRRYP